MKQKLEDAISDALDAVDIEMYGIENFAPYNPETDCCRQCGPGRYCNPSQHNDPQPSLVPMMRAAYEPESEPAPSESQLS